MQNLKRLSHISIMLMTVFFTVPGRSQSGKQSFKVITPDGVSITYEVHEKGSTALVFVHGWSCDRSYWRDQIQPFSERYKVVTLDLGGHGESGFGRTDWTIYSFGNDVATVIKELNLKRVILIGHSMGGDVITDAALQLPGLVTGLIMVDTYKKLGSGRSMDLVQAVVDELGTDFPANVERLIRSMFLPDADASLIDSVAKDMSSAPQDVALSAVKSSLTHSRQITHDLELLKLPVLTINPDNEPTDFESMRLHGVEVRIMQRIGHFLMMEDSEKFNELLETTIKKIAK